MQELIKDLFLPKIGNPILNKLSDSAILKAEKKKIAFTTDSYVVSPLFFKGGDIGKLAVCGTVNDLVVLGAVPKFMSLAIIIEEGLDLKILERITKSIADCAREQRILIVAADTKVVEKGACDKIFINTSGIGEVLKNRNLTTERIRPGDRIIITGKIAEHGLSILSGRKNRELDFQIKSDCRALSDLIIPLLEKTNSIKFMRDPTRGGLAATLNEISQSSNKGILIEEAAVPLSAKAKFACELLGIDPLNLANEGKAVLVVQKKYSEKIVRELNKHGAGRSACIIGKILDNSERKVLLHTVVGGLRIVAMPRQESLPRIC